MIFIIHGIKLTKRLLSYQIRDLNESDTRFICDLYQNKSVMKFIGPVLTNDVVESICLKMMNEIKAQRAIYQIIMNVEDSRRIGLLSMHWKAQNQSLESGMIVIPEFQNKGVCKWAQFAAMKLACNLFPAKRCTVYISQVNKAASVSYEHMGFVAVENSSKLKKHLNLTRWDYDMELLNER